MPKGIQRPSGPQRSVGFSRRTEARRFSRRAGSQAANSQLDLSAHVKRGADPSFGTWKALLAKKSGRNGKDLTPKGLVLKTRKAKELLNVDVFPEMSSDGEAGRG